jgi:Fe-S cluster biogenesis protein NfuA
MKKRDISITELKQVMEPVFEHVKQDGGDIEILEVNSDNVLKLKLLYACERCKLPKTILREGILKTIKKRMPEIKDVEFVNS